MTLAVFLLACSGDAPNDTANADDSAADADTDTDTDADTDSDGDSDTGPECATVEPGDDWAWSGQCSQMGTPVVITVDGCELTLDYSSVGGMTMGMPFSATVEGDIVTFADDNGVDGCVGTVERADKITGTCEDGCTFSLKR